MQKFKFLIVKTTPEEIDPLDAPVLSTEDDDFEGECGTTVIHEFASETEAKQQECFHSDRQKSQLWEFYCPDEFKSEGIDGGLDVIYVGPVSDEELCRLEEDEIEEAILSAKQQ